MGPANGPILLTNGYPVVMVSTAKQEEAQANILKFPGQATKAIMLACVCVCASHFICHACTAEEEVEVWEVERWMMAFRQVKRSHNEMCSFSGKFGVSVRRWRKKIFLFNFFFYQPGLVCSRESGPAATRRGL